MASDDVKYAHLVDTYAKQQATLVEALLRALLALWLPFTWWGRPDMVNAAAAASAVHVDAATRRARRLARAFMIRQLELMDAAPDAYPLIEDTYERGGSAIVEVYKRPARQLEYKIREDMKQLELESGTKTAWPERVTDEQWKEFTDRMATIVEDDLAATARDEAQKILWAAPKVIGYRRVIHPEFSKTGTCGLCVVASSRFYTKAELMPLHGNCKCTISPITSTQDLGTRLNREDLDKIYREAGSNYAEDLKKIGVTINEHGELGPILTRKGNHFRDVADVNRSTKRKKYTPYKKMAVVDQARMWTAMQETSERSIRILEAAKRAGTNLVDMTGTGRFVNVRDIDKAIEWHQSLIARAISNLA